MSNTLFHVEARPGIHLISSTSFGKSMEPGVPTRCSYLVIGSDSALLFDLALEEPDLKAYAEELAGKKLQTVLSHGHYDHTFNVSLFDEVWMHAADESLLRDGTAWQAPVVNCPTIHHLHDGDIIDLGNRLLDVIHMPGHTDGSILLLDRHTGTLLSGDTCTRRLLYGLHNFVPFAEFAAALEKIQDRHFDLMYSAHDRCGLPKSHIELMIHSIESMVNGSFQKVSLPGAGDVAVFATGDERSIEYFDIAVPARYIDTSPEL